MAENGQIKVALSVDVSRSTQQMSAELKSILDVISKNNKIQVQDIDVTKAINSLKTDLKKAFSDLDLGKALNLSSVSTQLDKLIEKTEKIKQNNGADGAFTAQTKIFTDMSRALDELFQKTMGRVSNGSYISEIKKEYDGWLRTVEQIRENHKLLSDSQRDQLQSKGVDLITLMRNAQELSEAEVRGAKEAEEAIRQKAEVAKKAAAETAAAQQRQINGEIKLLQEQLDSAYRKTSHFSDSDAANEYRDKYRDLTTQLNNVKGLEAEVQATELNRISSAIFALDSEISKERERQQAAEQAAASEAASSETQLDALRKEEEWITKVINLRKRMETYAQNNTAAYRDNQAALDKAISDLADPKNVSPETYASAKRAFAEITESASLAGKTGQTALDKIRAAFQRFSAVSLITAGIAKTIQYIQQMVGAVQDLDAAMTELKKVTDLTDTAYDMFYQNASKLAKNVGASVSDTINAVADFSRLGYSVDEATSLAEAALMYKNVGDGIQDVSQATESLISTMKAFNVEADGASRIIDAFNEVGNHFAISSTGIGEALQRSAAALAAAGNTMEESIGLVTAMNNVVQNPQVVGTSLKTMTMFLRAAKTEAEEAGISTDGMASSVSELREELKALSGVDIMLDEKNFKSTYQIMKELSEVWDHLADVTRANILERLGGKRGANAISSMLSNFKSAQAAAEAALNSYGSAYRENEEYLESIAGKLSILKASFEELSENVFSSNIVKFGVDVLNVIVNIVNQLAKAHVLMPSIIALVSAIKGLSAIKTVGTILSRFSSLAGSDSASSSQLSAITGLIGKLPKLQQKFVLAQLAANGFNSTITTQIAKELGLTATNEALGVSFSTLKSAIGGVNIALMVITAIIAGVSYAIDKHNRKVQESIETAKQVIDDYNSAVSSTEQNIKTIESLRDRYNELSAGVDENGNRISLTKEEYAEYLDVVDQLVDISPDIVTGYDSERGAIINYTTAIDDAIQAQNDYLDNAAQMKISNGDNIFTKVANSVDDSMSSIKKARDNLEETLYNGFAGFDDFTKKYALYDAAREVGIISQNKAFPEYGNVFSSMEELALLAKLNTELKHALQTKTDINGEPLFAREDIASLDQLFASINVGLEGIKTAKAEAADWIILNDKTSKDSWYNTIPIDQLDAFNEILISVIDTTKSSGENMVIAEDAAKRFVSAISSDDVDRIKELGASMADNPANAKAFDDAVNEYINALRGTGEYTEDELRVIKSALQEFDMSVIETGDDLGYVASNIDTAVSSIMSAFEQLKSGYDLLEKAQEDMASGAGLSAETIEALSKSLEDGEDITQYLHLNKETGYLELDIEAWRERSEAMMETNESSIDSQLEILHAENVELRKAGINYRKIAEEMKAFSVGNVNLLSRPVISGKDMKKAGWDYNYGDYATLFSSTFTAGNGSEYEYHYNQNVVVDITPILQNGEVLSPDALRDYMGELVESDNILEADAIENGGLGLVLNVTEVTESLEDAIAKSEKWTTSLHELQEQYYALKGNEVTIRSLNDLRDVYEALWGKIEESQKSGADLSSMFDGLDDIGKKSENLRTALDKVSQGTALTIDELKALAAEYPDLMQVEGLFDMEDVAQQQEALEGVYSAYEGQFNALIDEQMSIIEMARAEAEAREESTDLFDALISNLEIIRNGGVDGLFIGDDLKDAATQYDLLNDAINSVKKSTDLLSEIKSGDASVVSILSSITEMADQSEQSISDFVSVVDGELVYSEQAIRDWAYSYIDSLASTTDIDQAVIDKLRELVDAEIEVEQESIKIEDAFSRLKSGYDLLTKAREEMAGGGGLSSETVMDIAGMLEDSESLSDYIYRENGLLLLNEEAWNKRSEAMMRSRIAENQATIDSLEDQNSTLRQEILDIHNDALERGAQLTSEETAKLEANTTAIRENNNEIVSLTRENEILNDSMDGVVSGATEATVAVDSLTDAMQRYRDVNNLINDISGGKKSDLEILEELQQIAGDSGKSILDFISGFDGENIQYNTDALEEIREGIFGVLEAAEAADPSLQGITEYVRSLCDASEDGADGLAKLSDALSNADSISKFRELFTSADADSAEIIASAAQLAGDDISKLKLLVKSFNEDGTIEFNENGLDAFTAACQLSGDALVELEGIFPGITEWLYKHKEAVDETTVSYDSLQNAISTISSITDLINKVNTNSGDVLGIFNQAIEIAEKTQTKLGDILSFSGGSFGANKQALLNLYAAQFEGIEDLADDEVQALMNAFNQSIDNVIVDNAVSSVKTAAGLLEDIRSGEGDFLSMFSTVQQMAAQTGDSVFEFFDMVEGSAVFDEQFIQDWASSAIDSIYATSNADQEFIDSLKAMVAGEIELELASERVANSLSSVKSALSGYGDVYNGKELDYDTYKSLIDIDSQYADAVEYVNGVLTLNKEKYDEVTNSVIKKTEAEALAAAQEILTSEEYRNLAQNIDTLDEAQRQRLDNLNAEIMGYSVLASELDNASSAYQRFMRASDDDSGDRYNAAEKAYQVINDTLNNKDSDIFGKIGRNQYKLAMEFLIDPDIEVGTDAFDDALETIERYLKEGGEGVNNFIDDLTKHGFIDASGALSADLDEVAEKLGITEEFVRAMFEELNQYQDVPIEFEVETTGLEEGASAAGELGNEAEAAKSPMQLLSDAVNTVKESLDGINGYDVGITTDGAVSQVGRVSDALTKVINKLNAIKSMGNISTSVTTTHTTINRTIASPVRLAAASGTGRAVGGRTLVGELGMETVVDPNVNRWYTVGAHGAEFVNLPKGAIVFNAEQTKQLLNHGSTNSRGKSMASGNAAASLFTNIVNTVKNGYTAVKNAVTSVVKTATEYAKSSSIQKAPTTTKSTLSSSSSKKSSGSSSSSKKSSGSSKSSSSSSTKESALETLLKKYEQINQQTEHLIEHQEFLFEQAESGYDFSAMENSLREQAKLYKQVMDDTQKAISEMTAKGASDSSEELQKMENAYWDAYRNMYDIMDNLATVYVDGLNEKIDGVQGAYDNLLDAAEEFSTTGSITIDTFQKLTENGLQYMSLLEEVNGQYVINKENIDKIVAAEKEQLAIESALSYLSSISTALSKQDSYAVERLVDVSNKISSSTWESVFAQAALLKNLGLTEDQYNRVITNIQALRSITARVVTELADGADSTTVSYEEQADALDDILSLTEDLIRYETEERIDAINDEIDAYRKIIELKKESLSTTKDEDDYEKSVAEKVKEIAKLQSQIDKLRLDDSRSARAERANLMEQLAQLQDDLNEYQSDHAYESQVDALDAMAEAYEENRQSEIDELESSISSQEKIYQLAIQRLDAGWNGLYDDIIRWNTEAGNSINDEITEQWNKASEAVLRYGGYLQAVSSLRDRGVGDNVSSEPSFVVSDGVPEIPELPPEPEPEPVVEEVKEPEPSPKPIKVVKVTTGKWNVRTGAGTSYKSIGVAHTGDTLEYRGKSSGNWYAVIYKGKNAWISKNGSKIIEQVPKYHTGGIVGEAGTINQREVLAVLNKGETVLTTKMADTMYKIVDFQKLLSEKLGATIGSIGNLIPHNTIAFVGAGIAPATGNNVFTFNPSINVSIVHNGNMSDNNADAYGRRIASTALDELYTAFEKRGIHSI